MIAAPLMGFIFLVVNLASNIAMLMLLVRFLAAPFLYADSSSFLQAINQSAMTLSRPFRKPLIWIGFQRRDFSPLVAIVAILIVRGVIFALVRASFGEIQLSWYAMLVFQRKSFAMGALGLVNLFALILFFSVMFAKAGGFYGGVFFRMVDDLAATIFGHVRKVIRLKNLWVLLAVGLVYVCLYYALAISLLLWDIRVPFFLAFGYLSALGWIIIATLFLMFCFIAITWLSMIQSNLVDDSNRAWLFLRAMVLPALERTRSLVPWMRIGILDLSPILLFLSLGLLLGILWALQELVLLQLPGIYASYLM